MEDTTTESFFNPNEPWFNPVTAEFIGMPETIRIVIREVAFDIPCSILISAYFKCYPRIKYNHPVYDHQSFPGEIEVHGRDGHYYVTKVNAILELCSYQFSFEESGDIMISKRPFDCMINNQNDLYYAFRHHISKITKAHWNVPEEYANPAIIKFSDVPAPEPEPVPKPALETRPWKERVFSLGLPEYVQVPFPETQDVLELPVEFFIRLFNTQNFVWFPSVPKELESEYQSSKGRGFKYRFKMTPLGTVAEIHATNFFLKKWPYEIVFNRQSFTFRKEGTVVSRGSMLNDRAMIGWDRVLEDVIKNPELQEL